MSDISRLEALLPKSINSEVNSQKNNSVSDSSKDGSFTDILKDALNSVNDAQFKAAEAVEQAQSGDSTDIHNTMIALQKADVSLKMMLEVRNKILEAYQEVIRTQL